MKYYVFCPNTEDVENLMRECDHAGIKFGGCQYSESNIAYYKRLYGEVGIKGREEYLHNVRFVFKMDIFAQSHKHLYLNCFADGSDEEFVFTQANSVVIIDGELHFKNIRFCEITS